MASAELQSKMIVWRQKCIEGTITQAELTDAMTALRGDRSAAAQATTTKRTARAKAVIPTADDLLAELGIPSEDEENGGS